MSNILAQNSPERLGVSKTQNSQNDALDKANQDLAKLLGDPPSYGYLYQIDGAWRTARVSADRGPKRLPETVGQNGKTYYLLPLGMAKILRAYRTGELLGKRYGSDSRGKTQDAKVDIDRGSQNHPLNSLENWAKLIATLQGWGLSFSTITSSSSGGLHIIIPFSEPIWSMAVARKMASILNGAGFEIKPGHLEIFPNVPTGRDGGLMNGCRLPCITECSYVVDPYTLEKTGWRIELAEQLKAAAEANNVQDFLNLEQSVEVEVEVEPAVEPVVEATVEAEPIPAFQSAPRPKPKGFAARAKRAWFNLSDRFRWTETNRSNQVIGAHAAYVVETLGITDPVEAEQVVWERLRAHGYSANASKDEQKDRDHVRRWIACRLKKGNISPLGKNPGTGDRRGNKQRSEDAKHRLRLALKALRSGTFRTASELFESINSYLKKYHFSGLSKRTFQKLKMFWSWLVSASRQQTQPDKGSTPVEQRVCVYDSGTARDTHSFSPPQIPPNRGKPHPSQSLENAPLGSMTARGGY